MAAVAAAYTVPVSAADSVPQDGADIGSRPAAEQEAPETNDSTVAVDEEHFPDKAFRAYVSEHFDTDKDGSLSESEIEAAKTVDMKGNDDLVSLEGINYLKHLVSLDCSTTTKLPDSIDSDEMMEVHGGNVKDLDVSENRDLEELHCSGNYGLKLKSTDFSNNNPKLRVLELENVAEVGSVDVSGCPDLEVLNCASTDISKVDVTSNSRLKELNVSGTYCEGVDVSKNPELETLNISQCHDQDWQYCVDSVDVTHNPKLKRLEAAYTNIENIDVSQNPDLEILYLYYSHVKDLDISNNDKLVRIDMNHTGISSIDVSDKPDLFALNVEMTNVSKIDVTHNPKLFEVYLTGDKGIKELDLSGSPDMEHLRVSGTSITKLDLSHCPKLAAFYNHTHNEENSRTWESETVEAAPIESIDFSHNPKMFEIYLDGSPIKSIDVSNMKSLRHLHIDGTPITEVDVTHNKKLKSLTLSDTKIRHLDISKNRNLTTLDISNTSISDLTDLDLSNQGDIYSLNCRNAGVESIKLGSSAKVATIKCDGNAIAELDLEGRDNPKVWGSFSGDDQNAVLYLPSDKADGNKVYLKDLFSDSSRVTVKEGSGYTYDAADQSITFTSDDRSFDYSWNTKFNSDSMLNVHAQIKTKHAAEAESDTVYGSDVSITVDGSASDIQKVLVDGQELPKNAYTLTQKDGGKTVVKIDLSAAGIKDGTHDVKVEFTDGRARTSFEKKTYHPSVPDTKPDTTPAKKQIAKIIVNSKKLYYTGKKITPQIIVLDENGDMIDSADYTLSGTATSIGWHTVTIRGTGDYDGTVTGEYVIRPAKIKGFRLKSGKKKVDAIWSRSRTRMTGCQVQVSTRRSLKSAKVKTFKGEKRNHWVKHLRGHKKYYVRVRSWKTVKHNGKRVRLYSNWTKVKSIRTKR